MLGSTGMLGRYMYSYLSKFYDCTGFTRPQFEATSSSQDYLHEIISNGDVVINCVGVLKPNIPRVGAAHTIMINSMFPQVVADICSKNHANFIHISSDCVFTGRKGSYTEDDSCDASDLYARTKSIEPSNSLTLRTSFVGEEVTSTGNGLISWLIRQSSGTIDGYTNCLWNGVSCLQLCKVIRNIVDDQQMEHQVRHIYSPQVVSKYELCCIISQVYGLDINIKKSLAKEISGTMVEETLDRSLASKYKTPRALGIREQIIEQREYEI